MADADVYDFRAWKCWLSLDDERRQELLGNAWCPMCRVSPIADGWELVSDRYKVSIVGRCARCGAPIRRTVRML